MAGLPALLWLAPAWPTGLLAGSCGYRVWVDGAGLVWTQGVDLQGQLGNGDVNFRGVPQHPLGMAGGAAMVSGLDHVLALEQGGRLWGWGYSDVGQGMATFRIIHILYIMGLPQMAPYTVERQSKQLTIPYIATMAVRGRHSMALAR